MNAIRYVKRLIDHYFIYSFLRTLGVKDSKQRYTQSHVYREISRRDHKYTYLQYKFYYSYKNEISYH